MTKPIDIYDIARLSFYKTCSFLLFLKLQQTAYVITKAMSNS